MPETISELENLRAALAASEMRATAAEGRAAAAEADLAQARAVVSTSEAMIAALKLEIALLKRDKYGHSAERSARLDQLELQLEELITDAAEDKVAEAATLFARGRTGASPLDGSSAISRIATRTAELPGGHVNLAAAPDRPGGDANFDVRADIGHGYGSFVCQGKRIMRSGPARPPSARGRSGT